MSASAGDLYPPLTTTNLRGHSRQASKSSVCSNNSTTSINSTNNSIHHEKNPLRLVSIFLILKKQNIFLDIFYVSLIICTIHILIRISFLMSGRHSNDYAFSFFYLKS
jgi:hypothetical protein